MRMPPDRWLKDILIDARQVASKLNHYYLGVEHVFVVLLKQTDSAASCQVVAKGVPVQEVIDCIERYTKAEDETRHLWEGHPHTPRLNVVLSIAHDIALDDGRGEAVGEADVWQAIVEEGESLPIHILKRLGGTFP